MKEKKQTGEMGVAPSHYSGRAGLSTGNEMGAAPSGADSRPGGLWPAGAMTVLLLLLSFAPFVHAFDLFGWVLPDVFSGAFWSTGLTRADFLPPDMSWLPASLAALAIGIALAAIAQVSSGVLGARVGGWGKNQVKAVAKSAIIVLFIFIGFNLTSAPPNSFYYVGAVQIQNAVYFVQTVRSTMIAEFTSLTVVTALLSTVGNITPYFRPAGIIGISFSLAPAFRPVFDGLGILLSMMSVSVGEWFVHAWLLSLIKARMLSLFLPVGLFLRALGLDKAGDTLIALAIGFYFVYPFMLNVNAYAMEQYLGSEFGGAAYQSADGVTYVGSNALSDCVSANPASLTSGSVGCFFRLQMQAPLQAVTAFMSSNTGVSLLLLGLIQLLTGSLFASFMVGGVIFFTMSMLKAAAFYILVVSIIMPLFNLFITLTVIKELAQFMGTGIDLSAFERLL